MSTTSRHMPASVRSACSPVERESTVSDRRLLRSPLRGGIYETTEVNAVAGEDDREFKLTIHLMNEGMDMVITGLRPATSVSDLRKKIYSTYAIHNLELFTPDRRYLPLDCDKIRHETGVTLREFDLGASAGTVLNGFDARRYGSPDACIACRTTKPVV